MSLLSSAKRKALKGESVYTFPKMLGLKIIVFTHNSFCGDCICVDDDDDHEISVIRFRIMKVAISIPLKHLTQSLCTGISMLLYTHQSHNCHPLKSIKQPLIKTSEKRPALPQKASRKLYAKFPFHNICAKPSPNRVDFIHVLPSLVLQRPKLTYRYAMCIHVRYLGRHRCISG